MLHILAKENKKLHILLKILEILSIISFILSATFLLCAIVKEGRNGVYLWHILWLGFSAFFMLIF